MSSKAFLFDRYRVFSMKFDIMTLFPDMVERVLSESILGRAAAAGCFEYACHNIRDYAFNKHRKVDDTPYGGGAGMLMAPPPILACFEAILEKRPAEEKRKVIYLSPRGQVFSQAMAKELASLDHLVLLCGHYEGVDQRAIDLMGAEEVSVGDYVLTGGELPACLIVDAVARLLPGTLADPICFEEESHSHYLLEYPQYTRPPVFRGMAVPEVLLSGNHKEIDKWRLAQSLALTKERRPELYEAYQKSNKT